MRPISMRPRPDAMRPERVRPRLRPNDLASRPHGPRGLSMPALYCGLTVYSRPTRYRGFSANYRSITAVIARLQLSTAE